MTYTHLILFPDKLFNRPVRPPDIAAEAMVCGSEERHPRGGAAAHARRVSSNRTLSGHPTGWLAAHLR